MLISPPFLPARNDGDTDSAWLGRAMHEVVEDGFFPVGMNLCWHGGRHLEAPTNNNQPLAVRAIADGAVCFKRDATAQSADENHALAYGGWTSDGVVMIRHQTDIGAAADNTLVTVQFFSVYQHLINIPATVAVGQAIKRKTELGFAGHIAGQPNRMHFEIVCDDANLQRLIGRRTGNLPTVQNGRVNVVFGEIYVKLPAGTPVYAVPNGRCLVDNNPIAHTIATGNHPGAPQLLTSTAATAIDCYVGLRYAMGEGAVANRGDLTITTYREDGSVCERRSEAKEHLNKSL